MNHFSSPAFRSRLDWIFSISDFDGLSGFIGRAPWIRSGGISRAFRGLPYGCVGQNSILGGGSWGGRRKLNCIF